MLNKKEVLIILAVTLILAFIIDFFKSWQSFLYTSLAVLLVISINIAAKKLAALYLGSEIEMKIWEISRLSWHPRTKFKKPFPAGAFFPVISKILFFPFQSLVWMACLVFEVKPKKYRAAKRYGLYNFSEVTEYHIGLIAAAGIFINIIAAIISYFLGFAEFARLSLYYSFFNMIPLSSLDGNKIFFGNLVLWSFLATLVVVGMIFAAFII